MAVKDGVKVKATHPEHAWETVGGNRRHSLPRLTHLPGRYAAKLLEQGVTLADPGRIDVRGHLVCGRDVEIDINCILKATAVG